VLEYKDDEAVESHKGSAMPPYIGIPCGIYPNPAAWAPRLYGINQTYIHAVEAAGGVPLLIPLLAEEPALAALFALLDGLLLAGGDDVDPQHYGEQPHPRLGKVHPERDRVELLLLRWAQEREMPVLGICRGFQVLNVGLGGTLFQDLPSQLPGTNHAASTEQREPGYLAHRLSLAPASRLAAALRAIDLKVNTRHHQGIKDLAEPLRATGWSDDGLVEAVESAGPGWVVGVQCHPEDLVVGDEERWPGLFRSFVRACAAWRGAEAEAEEQSEP
jgi:putative glutamine amidotransferase